MGFTQPHFPDLDLEAWGQGDRSERIRPMATHVAQHGFGTPDVVYVLYAFKIAFYVLVGWAFAASTPGPFAWDDPTVFYKVVLWTMLFEVLGLGCGFGPLNLRISPPFGSFLYWLRPGTIRLAPWPSKVPLTGGDSRTVADVLLYAGLLASLVWALLGGLTDTQVGTVLVLLGVMGLRDKVVFLAARAEVYGSLALTWFMTDALLGAKLVFLVIWWGAAVSKLTVHFSNVIATMLSNAPLIRSPKLTRLLHRSVPDDLRPSRLTDLIAHGSTAIEAGVPVLLFLGDGGTLTTVAVVLMLVFHLGILTSMPMGVPLEWNVFMVFGVLTLFGSHADLHLSGLHDGWPLALVAVLLFFVVLGNLRPALVSFLPAMRYYAGNWDTSVWLFEPAGLAKLEAGTLRAAPLPYTVLEGFYGKEQAVFPIWIGYAFRCMHSHGRALFTLVDRLQPSPDVMLLEGELVAGVVLGWNFGDGHMHNEQLLASLQKRCGFEPGECRVVMLESQPLHVQAQQYRLVDAATGLVERGEVKVRDMVAAQPWELLPVHPVT